MSQEPVRNPHSGLVKRRPPKLLALVTVMLLSFGVTGILARGAQPPPEATPGAVGFQGAIIGGIDPAVIPGYRLAMAESVFEPGAYVTQHTHPTAIVVCVQSGALGFAIQQGTASITRSGVEGAETLALNTEIVLEPRDCVAFDHFAEHTAHTGWNAGDEQTVLWEARLLKTDEPFTVFVNDQGTPVPAP